MGREDKSPTEKRMLEINPGFGEEEWDRIDEKEGDDVKVNVRKVTRKAKK